MGFDWAHAICTVSTSVLRAIRVSNKNEVSPIKPYRERTYGKIYF